jgi:hypothetical protein
MTLSANAANLFYRKTLTQLPPTRLTLPGEATMSVSLNGINNASQTVGSDRVNDSFGALAWRGMVCRLEKHHEGRIQ